MKIYAPSFERINIGGGGTFLDNLSKGLFQINSGIKFIEDSNQGDIIFIAGASLTNRDFVLDMKSKGKKIVLRIDNILEDSKNRNSGMSRLRDFAELADFVIYQSNWAYRLMKPYCSDKRERIIYNGVDTKLFKPGQKTNRKEIKIFYSKYSRNEVKRFHEVQYFIRELGLDKLDCSLVIVGRFARDLINIDNPFEFHNGERFNYFGIQKGKQLVSIMQDCDVAFLPYFADACSNTVLECQACGLPVMFNPYGGTREIVSYGYSIDWKEKASKMLFEALNAGNSFDAKELEKNWGIKKMATSYLEVFNSL